MATKAACAAPRQAEIGQVRTFVMAYLIFRGMLTISDSQPVYVEGQTPTSAQKMFVGSFNYDQRSLYLNTEIGIVFEQPEIAATAAQKFVDNIDKFAFKVKLSTVAGRGDSLQWRGIEDGRQVVLHSEPYVGGGTKAAVRLMRLLPVDWLL